MRHRCQAVGFVRLATAPHSSNHEWAQTAKGGETPPACAPSLSGVQVHHRCQALRSHARRRPSRPQRGEACGVTGYRESSVSTAPPSAQLLPRDHPPTEPKGARCAASKDIENPPYQLRHHPLSPSPGTTLRLLQCSTAPTVPPTKIQDAGVNYYPLLATPIAKPLQCGRP